jgi:peptidoglycan/xylan/chitin deacetylase (PgdA/CDA1 family)
VPQKENDDLKAMISETMFNARDKLAAIPLAKKAHARLIKWTLRSGALNFWNAIMRRQRLILTFHRIRPEDQRLDSFDTCPSVSVGLFREILAHGRERFKFVPLPGLCAAGVQDEPLAAVTFDDGWRDNYDLAWPVLGELGVPATIFMTTGKIGSRQPFWQQALGRAFRDAAARPDAESSRRLAATVFGTEGSLPKITRDAYRRTAMEWKRLSGAELEDRLHSAGCLSADYPDGERCFLSAAEICEMAAGGVMFGSHTVTHAILPQQSSADIDHELRESKTCLERLLGRTVDMVAYPDGAFSDEVVSLARAAGYRIGCTTQRRRLSTRGDSLRLSRIDCSWYCPDTLDCFDPDAFAWQTR